MWVELSAKGFDTVKTQIAETEQKMQAFKMAAEDAMKSTNAAFRNWAKDMLVPDTIKASALALEQATLKTAQLKEMFGTLQKTATWAFAGITGGTLAWVRAGLQGTTVGNALGVQFQLLSREIASVFLPQIMGVVNGVRSVIQWFRNLTGGQQEVIGKVIMTAAALTGVVTVIGPLNSGIRTLITSWKALEAAFAASPIGATVLVITALAMGTEKGRAAIMSLARSLGDLLTPLAKVVELFGSLISKLSAGVVDLFAKAIEKITVLMQELKSTSDKIIDSITRTKIGHNIDPETATFMEKLAFLAKEPITRTMRAGLAGLTGGRQAAYSVFRGTDEEPGKKLGSGHVGFEGASQTYKRIAEAGLRNETARLQEQTNSLIGEGNGYLATIASAATAGLWAAKAAFIGP